MKISIKQKNERPHRLVLFVPTRAMRWKVVSRALSHNKDIMMDFSELHELLRNSYKQIKEYVRKHGHFYLVKVDTHDGVHVRIKV